MTVELSKIDGKGKYSIPDEQILFLTATTKLERTEVRTFSVTPAYSNCRLSALELTPDHFDTAAKVAHFRTLRQHDRSFTKLLMTSIRTR